MNQAEFDFFVFNFGGQVKADVNDVSDLLFDGQEHFRRHGKLNGFRKGSVFRKRIFVSASDSQRNWLLHLSSDCFFFFVNIGRLGKLEEYPVSENLTFLQKLTIDSPFKYCNSVICK
jgi:hypothetical protein